MTIDYPIYEDGVIAVKLMSEDARNEQLGLFHLAIRYLNPGSYKRKNGEIVKITNVIGGETD